MRRLLIIPIILSAALCSGAQAQQLNPGDYIYPILNVKRLYAANFGEIRPGHFHTGVDIKTEGSEGKPLVAVADGYISRVSISSGGYGRALYLVTDKGTTAVYGHLQRFCDELETYVQSERYGRQSNNIDLTFDPAQWPIKQGECIGKSGNSGRSAGPHLHYELRQSATGRYLNLVRENILQPNDNIPPRIVRIHYVETDTLEGVCMRSAVRSFEVTQTAPGHYRPVHPAAFQVGRKGYFVAEVTDRRNGVNNTFGVWRLTAFVDQSPFFEYRMDGFLPRHSSCSQAVSCYPLQNTSRNEVIRLAQLADCSECLYTRIEERGIVRTSAGQTRRIALEAEDDRGNTSRLEFDIRGRDQTFRATRDTTATPLYPHRAAIMRLGNQFSARIPAQALYEAVYCRPEQLDAPRPDSGVVLLSPAYRLFDSSIPLRRGIEVSIRTPIPPRLQLRAALARLTPRGLVSAGGAYADGAVRATTRTTGAWVVVADTLPPRIEPRFSQGADLTRTTSLAFRATDNFAGLKSWSLRLDGRWVPCDRFPMKNSLVHVFDKQPEKRLHTVELSVTDECGNTAHWAGTFYR